ncbi:MAG: VWA domain-containing protein [Bacillota bacterium]|nr:VWA domain-containing protein [Bacillota bacterium]
MSIRRAARGTSAGRNVLRFVGTLRSLGVPAGSGEVLDAMAALHHVNMRDRSQVKLVLSAALAKDERSRSIFDQAFDLYFVSAEQAAVRARAREAEGQARARRIAQSEAELRFQGQSLELSGEHRETYAQLSQAQQERLREFLSRSSGGHGVDASFLPLIEHIVRGHLERWRQGIENGPGGPSTGDEIADDVVRMVRAGSGSGGDPLLYVDIKDISEADMPRARVLLRRLAKRLATRVMRRYRRARAGDRVDFRRTVRANLRYGGVPVELRFSRRKVLKPKIVLVCDVSGSMSRYASFILQFSYGLAKVVRDLEAFLFAEDLERVSEQLRDAADVELTIGRLLESSRVWGKGTNLAVALRRLNAEHRQVLTGDALVLVVSDTKTLAVTEAAAILAEMSRRVRDIVWLNTVPASEWPGLPTVAALAPHVRMYECSTLADLDRVLRLTMDIA